MTEAIEAIYDAGVFRPLSPVAIPDQQRVSLIVSTNSSEVAASRRAAVEALERSFKEVSVPMGGKCWTSRDELHDR